MNRTIWITCGLVPVLLLAGCGGGSEPAKEASNAAPAAAAPTVDPATAATVTGKVMFSGTAPVMRPIDMGDRPVCAEQHSSPVKSEEVVVNSNGTLKNVLVYVKAGLPAGDWPTPSVPVELDQKGCMYAPHGIAVMANQEIDIKNTDPTNHNVHWIPTVNREWNESQPPGGDVKVQTLPRPEIGIPVKCNVHPWMRSYIHVMSNPFYAITGDDGSFTIKGLPPGDYTLEAWHEKYGTQEFKVTVGPSQTGTAEFTFKG